MSCAKSAAYGRCTRGAAVGGARCCKWCVQGLEVEDDVSGYSVSVNTRYSLAASQRMIHFFL